MLRRDRAAPRPRTRSSARTPRRCPITGLAEGVAKPESTSSDCTSSRPVDKMPLLEIIKGEKTADEALAQVARLRQADQEDPDRRQRQPRLLHQPRDRHVHQRGLAMLAEGVPAPSIEQAASQAGYPAPVAAALRRAQPGADAARSARVPAEGRRSRRASAWTDHPAIGVIDQMLDEFEPAGRARGRRLLRVRRRQADRGCGPVCARSSAGRRPSTITARGHEGADAVRSRRSSPSSASTRA